MVGGMDRDATRIVAAMTKPPPRLLDSVIAPDSVHRATLANGLRVLVRPDRRAPVVAIVTYVKAGYFDETDAQVGIAHVLEHMYFKGTPTRGVGQIARETKASGGYLNAGTIYDHTHYYTVLPSTGLAAGLAVQADAYANSVIDAGELARELEVIVEEVKRKHDNPASLATETLFEKLHDVHRIRRWRMGREEALRAFTRDDLVRFYRNYYRPSNTVLAIVGDVDPAEAIALVDQQYGTIPDGVVRRTLGAAEPDAATTGFRYHEFHGDIAQSELLMGWRTPGTDHADTPALDVLATLLGGGRASRLYRAVRERRLAASISANNYTPTDLGVFMVHAAARADTSVAALGAAWDQVRRVREGEVTAHEVLRARRVLEAAWLRRCETMEGQANHLAAWELLGDWQMGSDYVERMLAVDAAAVMDVALRWLAPERAAVVAYRPASAPAFASSAADMLGQLNAQTPESLSAIGRPPSPTPVPGARGWVFERQEAGVHIFRTASGVPLLVQRHPGSIGYFGWFVRGGATDETAANSGITTLMARTALKGTARRTAERIAEDSEYLGGVLSAAANADGFQWTISVPARRLEEAAELLADVVQRPSYGASALESERAVALANIASLRDDMYRWPLALATSAAWEGDAYGRSVLGTEESVRSIDANALHRWHAARALEAPGVLVCVADADPDDVASMVARFFGALSPATGNTSAAPLWPTAAVARADQRDKSQSALALLFPGASRGDDARFAAAMLAGIASGLGGRFFSELRERQSLAYTVMAAAVPRYRAGAFAAYIAMSPEKEAAARDGLLAQFARFGEDDVTDDELTHAKIYALGSWAIRRESGGAVAGDMADSWLFGRSLQELTDYETRVRNVTARDMRAAARRWFDPARCIEGIVRGRGG